MLIYWLLILVPLVIALAEKRRPKTSNSVFCVGLTVVVLFFVMAFRDTCGDHRTYMRMLDMFQGLSLQQYMTRTEPLFGFFCWLSAKLEWGVYGVNSFCALVFLTCLFLAAIREPLPMFFTALSIPYFVIVVAMGYTRQGVAAGLVLLGIQSVRSGKPWQFVIQAVLAAGFHSSAFAVLPAILFAKFRFRGKLTQIMTRMLVLSVGVHGALSLQRDQLDFYVAHYINSSRYNSSGAVLRCAVTGVAAVFFFSRRRAWSKEFGDDASLIFYALAALALVPISFVASTPADRMGLYLMPFQLIVFARLPLLQKTAAGFSQFKLGITGCYILYFYTWLHLGRFAQDLWVPYKSVLW